MNASTNVLHAANVNSTLRETAAAGAASLFIALLAQVTIPLPFTPVPFTLQTLGIYLAAAALGPRLGALSVIAYLAEGAAGLPVFSAGAAGFFALLGPTGGYLLGFVPAAFVTGLFFSGGRTAGAVRSCAAFAAGAAVFYCAGLLQLSHFVPQSSVLKCGLIPFLPGEAVKIALAARAAPFARKFITKLTR